MIAARDRARRKRAMGIRGWETVPPVGMRTPVPLAGGRDPLAVVAVVGLETVKTWVMEPEGAIIVMWCSPDGKPVGGVHWKITIPLLSEVCAGSVMVSELI